MADAGVMLDAIITNKHGLRTVLLNDLGFGLIWVTLSACFHYKVRNRASLLILISVIILRLDFWHVFIYGQNMYVQTVAVVPCAAAGIVLLFSLHSVYKDILNNARRAKQAQEPAP